jgi:signal peptidase II
MLKNTWSRWLLISLVVFVLDVYSKHLIQQAFQLGDHLLVGRFFDLVRYHNEGAAFSFLATEGGWQRFFFSAIAFIASVVIVYLLRKNSEQTLFCLALSLVLGGALGNLYDRLTLGYVVDFLFFHINQYYWPAFNLADSAITAGVALLLLDGFKKPK